MSRRQDFATLLPGVIKGAQGGDPISLKEVYAAFERDHPLLVDDEVEISTGATRWKHELRWELETLVICGVVRRRKDLGKGIYSA